MDVKLPAWSRQPQSLQDLAVASTAQSCLTKQREPKEATTSVALLLQREAYDSGFTSTNFPQNNSPNQFQSWNIWDKFRWWVGTVVPRTSLFLLGSSKRMLSNVLPSAHSFKVLAEVTMRERSLFPHTTMHICPLCEWSWCQVGEKSHKMRRWSEVLLIGTSPSLLDFSLINERSH